MISVIMSIFNEKNEEIIAAMDSIFRQTYKNFEFIVVLDMPDREDILEIMKEKYDGDTRLKLIRNRENIGLALSMNEAAKIAKGKYLVRMDADDISCASRLEKQIDFMTNVPCDLLCTNYIFIDELGNELNIRKRNYDNVDIGRLLPYCNTIHHPTVMMKRDLFMEIGGYRNFPCSQDYDLWLRLYERGCIFRILKEPLLKYRIRSQSITQKNIIKQFVTLEYIKKLYRERRRSGQDSYSVKNYEIFLKNRHVYDEVYLLKTQNEKKIKDLIDNYKGNKRKRIVRRMLMAKLFLSSGFYRYYYIKTFSCILGIRKVKEWHK